MANRNEAHPFYPMILAAIEEFSLEGLSKEAEAGLAEKVVEAIRDQLARATETMEPPEFTIEPEESPMGLALDRIVNEGIGPILQEFWNSGGEAHVSLVMVGPGEKVMVASTEPDARFALEALSMGVLSTRRGLGGS